MRKYIYPRLILVLVSFLVLVSCNKYLDIVPKGVQLLSTVTDYDRWLNSTALETSMPRELLMLGDDMDKPSIANSLTLAEDRAYTWQDQFSVDVTAIPLLWSNFYKSIYYFNTVLVGIDEATGDETKRKSLKAEAMLGRALEYFYLVNLYGKSYNPSTSAQDLAVPFVTSNDVSDPVPARSTVKEVYDRIIGDLNASIPDLPEDNSKNRYRGTVAAGYSMLARIYLYMGNYAAAAQNAQLALDHGPNVILDYSTMFGSFQIPGPVSRSDVIYARLPTSYFLGETPTLAFLRSFNVKDKRLSYFYTTNGNTNFNARGQVQFVPYGTSYTGAYPNWGTSVAEMRLIIAEAAARANDLNTALSQLDLVRKTRFASTDYVKFTSGDQAVVLQKVLDERSFELAFIGLRWFDMRRLDAEGRMSTVSRYNSLGTVIASIAPGSNKYTLQIPLQVMYYNPDWPQNPRP